MDVVLLASAGVAILLVGGGIGFWVGRSGVGGGKARVKKAEAELEAYKREVTEHFGQTAAHFQAIGKQYRELYEHMASGAQALCESDEAGKRLLFAPGVDAASPNEEEPAAEAVVEAEGPRQTDDADQPDAEETGAGSEAAKKSADEQAADKVAESEGAETDMTGVTEATTEGQADAEAETARRTIH